MISFIDFLNVKLGNQDDVLYDSGIISQSSDIAGAIFFFFDVNSLNNLGLKSQ